MKLYIELNLLIIGILIIDLEELNFRGPLKIKNP